jgi:hypothetical protein
MPDLPPISREQVERLTTALRGEGRSDFIPMLEATGATSIGEMTAVQATRALSWLQRRRAHSSPSQLSDY